MTEDRVVIAEAIEIEQQQTQGHGSLLKPAKGYLQLLFEAMTTNQAGERILGLPIPSPEVTGCLQHLCQGIDQTVQTTELTGPEAIATTGGNGDHHPVRTMQRHGIGQVVTEAIAM